MLLLLGLALSRLHRLVEQSPESIYSGPMNAGNTRKYAAYLFAGLLVGGCSKGTSTYLPTRDLSARDLGLQDERPLQDLRGDVLPQDLRSADQDPGRDALSDATPDLQRSDLLSGPDQQPPDLGPTPDASLCGNGQVDSPPETCDKAITTGDEGACPVSCDDGNHCTVDGMMGSSESCTASCAYSPISNCCGNGILEGGEQCDDGNKVDHDSCNASCLLPGGHLLITEVSVSPGDAEFVEIFNPAASPVSLDHVYLSDCSDYFMMVTGSISTGGGNDFTVRFPAGTTLGPGQYLVIAIQGSVGYKIAYGKAPDLELKDTETLMPDMEAAVSGSIGGKAGLTDSGELLILFSWDGISDLVQDLDYVVWKGSSLTAIYKFSGSCPQTGTCVDGPDADDTASSYLDDTPVVDQSWLVPPGGGGSIHRCNYLEGAETKSGGNGMMGHDETSEPFEVTWQRNATTLTLRTPGEPAPQGMCPL